MSCAPTATAWPRSPQTASRPRSCGRCRAPARTWSRPGSRWSTSSPASWKAAFPAPSGCSTSRTRQPPSRSCAAIPPATPPPPSPRPPSLPSCAACTTAAARPSASCSAACRPPQQPGSARPRRPDGRSACWPCWTPSRSPAARNASWKPRSSSAWSPRRPAHLHQPAPGRPRGPGGGAAGRARRRARPLPYRGSPGRPGWGRASHHHLGQTPGGQVPLGLRQEATGGAARLRR
jgi:hypothetical protein